MASSSSLQHTLSSSSTCLLFLFASLSCFQIAAADHKQSTKLYVVSLGERQHDDPDLVTASHHDLLSSILQSKEEAVSSIIYSYRHGFSGFAAMLTSSQAEQIAEMPEVMSIKEDQIFRLHTTRSWDYLGVTPFLQPGSNGLLQAANYGEDIIIGVIDSGIWPESKSFDDHGYGPIPSRWKGTCQVGQNFTTKNCNRKVIGARWYPGGVDPSDIGNDYLSPRGNNSHGTHTASTAAGSFVGNASFEVLARGLARGGAPHARLAIYKACWGSQARCPGAAVLKAIDDAIHDGVDVLSLSLEGNYFDSIYAVAKGITVVQSAGNSGPVLQTMENDLPWVITVAASTMDRSFPTLLTLDDRTELVGQSYYSAPTDEGFKELVPIQVCSTDRPEDLKDAGVEGKIVLCGDWIYNPDAVLASSGAYVKNYVGPVILTLFKLKAKGVLFSRPALDLLVPCGTSLICVFVDNDVFLKIYATAAQDSNKTATMKVSPATPMFGSQVPSPFVAAFSSRGPSLLYPDIIKPDVAAPGVSILAATKDSYGLESGTSMACPHVAGIVALLKAVHPHWSPSAIKSALVTTASTTTSYGGPILADGHPRKIADPFDFGGGQVDPNRAMDPGLIYDIEPQDYFKFFRCTDGASSNCDVVGKSRLYNLNLPSVSIPDLKTSVTVWRTVTNVGEPNSTYMAVMEPPPGVKMSVDPAVLEFSESKTTHTFAITFTSLQTMNGVTMFGSLTWCDHGGKHSVRIPIAVRIIAQDNFSDTS